MNKVDKYRFYRTYDDGWKGHRPLKVWDHQPTASEVDDELKKLSMKVMHQEPYYIRCWRASNDGDYTVYDFGSWSVYGIVSPDIYEAYVEELR